jgi:hypothetical protein
LKIVPLRNVTRLNDGGGWWPCCVPMKYVAVRPAANAAMMSSGLISSRGRSARETAIRDRLAGEAGERAEVEGEIARGLKALVRILFEAVAHHAFERAGDADVELVEIGRLVFEDRVQRLDRRVAAERRASRQHLVEHRAEREDVGAVIAGAAADLLGRHVADGAEEAAGLGRRRRAASARDRRTDARPPAGDARARPISLARPKSRIFTWPSRVMKRFSGFRSRWMMPFARAPRRGRARSAWRSRSPCAAGSALPQSRPQRFAFQQLADDVVLIAFVADVVDRDDVRMVEHPRRARFLSRSGAALRVVREIAGEDLDRDVASEARVDGAIHLAHAARADLCGDPVRTELRAGNEHRWAKDSSRERAQTGVSVPHGPKQCGRDVRTPRRRGT